MSLEIKSFIAKNGERFSQLYSRDDPWPLFYPTAFIVRSVRQSCTASTQTVHLEAIKQSRLLDQALVHTGLTRGVEQVVLVGDWNAACAAILAPATATKRHVNLTRLLDQAFGDA